MTNNKPALTKEMVLNYLGTQKLMTVATNGEFPWIASVYYTFDRNLNIYFLSSPTTLHVQQILQNPKVAVSIADSHQDIAKPKRGMQMSGVATQISGVNKIRHALLMWKSNLGVVDPSLTHKVVIGSMFMVTPNRIKLFDQELFDVEDGQEPVLDLKTGT